MGCFLLTVKLIALSDENLELKINPRTTHLETLEKQMLLLKIQVKNVNNSRYPGDALAHLYALC